MANDVALTSAVRTNLLSLIGTNRLIDQTQGRLATGRKVNSALDDPRAFFAAQSLSNRATDLNRLLDSMGQSISTIKETDNGITALSKLVEQADAIAQQAREALAGGEQTAEVSGTTDLSGVTDLTSRAGITNGDTLTFTVTDPSDSTTPAIAAANGAVTIATSDSLEQLVTKINDLNDDTNNKNAIQASITDDGKLEVRTTNGGNLRIDFESGADTAAANQALATDLGFGTQTASYTDGGASATEEVSLSVSSTAALVSYSFYDTNTSKIAARSTALTDVENASATALFTDADGDARISIGVNGGTRVDLGSAVDLAGVTIQDIVDDINGSSSLNTLVKASYDEVTGQLSIRAVDASVTSVEIGVADGGTAGSQANFGFGVLDGTVTLGETLVERFQFGSAAGELAQLETDFNNVRTQIDQLVKDSNYRGTNLLNGDELLTVFNEDRTSSLTTKGGVFTSAGLGISEANFGLKSTVDSSINEINGALGSVRSFGNTLANDLSVIQTRQDFTEKTINTLEEGSDKLTLADENEEGAKLLALQTRQQLAITSLALATQSQRNVLSLF